MFSVSTPRSVPWSQRKAYNLEKKRQEAQAETQRLKDGAEIRDVRGPFDHPGAGYTQVMRALGRERLGTWEVTAFEPGRWREVRGTLPLGIPFSGRDEFRAVPAGTVVSLLLSWDMPWGIVGRCVAGAALPFLRRQLRGNAVRAAALLREHG